MKYQVRVKENGEVLEEFTTIEECEDNILEQEEADIDNGSYDENWYEIYDTIDDVVVGW